MLYLCVKWLHILSSTVLFGTGAGTAFFMLMANRTRDLKAIRFATRTVVIADWLFTTPAVIIQPVTGFILAKIAGYPLSTPWLVMAILLYLFAGACWLPVVWIQLKLRTLAAAAETELPAQYWALNRGWLILGSLAFPAVMVIFWLMVFTPSF